MSKKRSKCFTRVIIPSRLSEALRYDKYKEVVTAHQKGDIQDLAKQVIAKEQPVVAFLGAPL